MSEEDVRRAKRVFESLIDIIIQSSVVDVCSVEEAGRRRDHVGSVVQSESGGGKQKQEEEMRQRVSDEFGGWTSQRSRHLQPRPHTRDQKHYYGNIYYKLPNGIHS